MTLPPGLYEERKKLVDVTRRMLSGNLSFLEGSRSIQDSSVFGVNEFDEDFIPFILISSETDHLPLGDVRQLWDPEALARLQPEIERAEEWAKQTAIEACRRLVDRFGPAAIRREIAETAKAMLDGQMTSFIEGAHRIVLLRAYADLAEHDPDFASLVEIDSRFEFLPPTDGRENWPQEMLDQKYPEVRRAEEWSRQMATADCQRLINRFC